MEDLPNIDFHPNSILREDRVWNFFNDFYEKISRTCPGLYYYEFNLDKEISQNEDDAITDREIEFILDYFNKSNWKYFYFTRDLELIVFREEDYNKIEDTRLIDSFTLKDLTVDYDPGNRFTIPNHTTNVNRKGIKTKEERMKEDISRLREQISKLEKENSDLKTELECIPGQGKAFLEAKERFETLKYKLPPALLPPLKQMQ